MKKIEAQHNHAQNQSAQRQGGVAALESPQGERIAQLEAMAESSPQAGKLAQLAAMVDSSPAMAAQRKLLGRVYGSPAMAAQRKAVDVIHTAQRVEAPSKRNNTGLPDNLKSGIESLSGMSMDNVKVHYNSSQPAQLNALAYAQGTDIHVAPGQEQHLPHEAWHVVQQAQGRVMPTMQMKDGVPVNDDAGLEREADVMGARALADVGVAQCVTNGEQKNRGAKTQRANTVGVSGQSSSHSSILAELPAASQNVQRRTLEQAGLHNGMAAIADQPLIGGDVGPLLGTAYVADLGVQATKHAALSVAGASYAGFVAALSVANLLSRTRITDAINATKDAITQYIAGLNGNADLTAADAAAHIKTNIIEPTINPHFKTDVDDGELTAILAALRQPITKNGANKFFGNPLAPAPLTAYIRGRINAGWRANANVPPIDPFLYRATSSVGGAELSVSYQHSPDWPGYVTHIQDDVSGASMRLNGAIQNPDVAGIPNQFGRKHHETGDANLAGDLTLDALDPRVDNERRLDSMTKLAGEGARFICVRNNIGIMTDKSRFYVMGLHSTKYVTLEDLWSSWATGFAKQNNISNAAVRAAIDAGALWTYDHHDGQEARVFSLLEDPPMGAADVDLT